MSAEIAILIAAGIAAAASVLTLFLTRFFDDRSEKRKERENFFIMVYPKRMELYDEITKLTNPLVEPSILDTCITEQEFSNLLLGINNGIVDLIYRCNTYGSTEIGVALKILFDNLLSFRKNSFGYFSFSEIKKAYIKLFIPIAADVKKNLIALIRDESGASLVDKKLSNFHIDLKIKKYVPKYIYNESRPNPD